MDMVPEIPCSWSKAKEQDLDGFENRKEEGLERAHDTDQGGRRERRRVERSLDRVDSFPQERFQPRGTQSREGLAATCVVDFLFVYEGQKEGMKVDATSITRFLFPSCPVCAVTFSRWEGKIIGSKSREIVIISKGILPRLFSCKSKRRVAPVPFPHLI